jgi:cell division protein FtsB
MRASTLKLLVKFATVFAVVLFAFLFVLLVFQYVKIHELETVQNRLSNELNQIVQERESYESELDYIQNNYNSYVEDYVREVLGWGRQNEIKFESE